VRAALAFLPDVWVVPAGRPVHRVLSGRADARLRFGWMRRIFAGDEHVRVLDWEVKAEQPVPTIETLRRLHREYPGLAPVLLLGSDAFASISSWVDYPAHLDLCDVAVFSRHGSPPPDVREWRPLPVEQWRQSPGHGRVIRVDVMLPDISATRLRVMAEEGKSLRGLVPDVIRQEIEGVYGAGGATKEMKLE